MSVIGYAGRPVHEIASEMGVSLYVTKDRLNKLGYGVYRGEAYRKQSAQEVQDEIAKRLMAAPPSFPCPYCNAARSCQHRLPNWGAQAA